MNHGLQGDSMIAFEGPCDVSFEHMVDGEDLLAQSAIRGGHMLHFILEEFDASLELAVTRQRLLAAMARDLVSELSGEKIEREGDDLYWKGGKLSISIATVSPVSALIHFAVNVTNENTPVKTAALNDLKITPRHFAESLCTRFAKEVETIKQACTKVNWVK